LHKECRREPQLRFELPEQLGALERAVEVVAEQQDRLASGRGEIPEGNDPIIET